MKAKIWGIGIFILIFFAASYETYHIYQQGRILQYSQKCQVILAYDSQQLQAEEGQNILAGYESVLQEEGIPYQKVDIYQLVKQDAAGLSQHVPWIVFPDRIAVYLPPETASWLHDYVSYGGMSAVIYDAGIQNKRNRYMDEAVFTDLLGINYNTYQESKQDAFFIGKFCFVSQEARDFWGIPEGKTMNDTVLSGYSYGALELPVRNVKVKKQLAADDIIAEIKADTGEKVPGIIKQDLGNGKIFYVNLPLGGLKVSGDDLMLRSFLRTLLFKYTPIPHVMNVPDGKGAFILNWHIDSAEELDNLPEMIEGGFLHENIKMSFHITAGDYDNEIGDAYGFDAAGERGRQIINQLLPYGSIGSHGGWAHNWFAANYAAGNFTLDDVRHYISINNLALSDITGQPVTEYAAPDGVFPEPESTQLMEELGIEGYYYTGDSGSMMNRTFYNGKMISSQAIAIPIMPFGKYASLYEMNVLGHIPQATVMDWMQSIVVYSHDNRTTRMFYSHPYDTAEYPDLIPDFLDWLDAGIADGYIKTMTMTEAAGFYKRVLNTQYKFLDTEQGMRVILNNSAGLQDITVAIPKKGLERNIANDLSWDEDEYYYYITVIKDENEGLSSKVCKLI